MCTKKKEWQLNFTFKRPFLIFTWFEKSKKAFITIEEECTVAMLCDDVFEYTNTTS